MLCSRCAAHAATTPSGLCAGCASAAPAPGPLQPIRSLAGLSNALTVLLALVAVLDAVAVYAALNSRAVIGALADDTGDHADAVEKAQRADTLMTVSSSLSLTALLATAVVFVVWFHRARVNADVLGPAEQRRGRGWAIGSWFIPIANLWIPRQVAGDIWDASEPGGHRTSRAVLNTWWALWVSAALLGRVAARMWDRAEEIESIRQGAAALAATGVVDLASAVAALVFVRRLTAMQHAKAAAGPPAQPVPAAG
ncbi:MULTISPECIES: DUF4328 domain-containing protein [Streptomyces]|uniref:DUF4328 domain-containing protein n=1 Tax=Streptomyces fradiae ATCC 10745 = DSM 40063 TaxID=1319510 RepID=A0A1Y2NUF1_STRFR|nr:MULTISPECIES: DUF4328 domain-containing protein [Streptomyces]KAF0647477.1 hypothetical protein K701_23215 [Streptomyces fradiae ATCC 10745 = DSM 40063]KAF0647544.1 hypothetical protein K701_22505 [Streptomyces fradiae ATCC 10745 = DSM 40063]OSY51154.1 hypothetical protein BG846_03253 [Streptomyces fradiae ATCC 10745 = DSM 40063]QEV15365.1 DUF4328 domain-containing protein [Streptomyces fradiae ATCC 10745 = DSM 40063]